MTAGYADEVLVPWGRVTRLRHQVAHPRHRGEAAALVAAAAAKRTPLLGVGLHRSYGDSGLNPNAKILNCRGLDRFMAFDRQAGLLRAEAGTSLDEILRLIVPHGWFLPVTPGTIFVTLAGAIANDVHGKNHHRRGSFGRHVRRIGLLRSDHGQMELSPEDHPDLFHATLGGLGLTGLITWAEISLIPIASSTLRQEARSFGNLAEFFDLNAQSEEAFEHVSAWVDCTASKANLGRGVLFRANWAETGPLLPHRFSSRLSVPIEAPSWLMNPWTLKAANVAIRAREAVRSTVETLSYASALYPLDAIGHWNRAYGAPGFYQHQCVIPPDSQERAMTEVLQTISASGQGSFLSVMKTLGAKASGGLVSFHGPGTSLALDFPNRGASTLALLERLDQIVTAAGGRIYPAKDGRMSAATYRAGYPGWVELERQRDPLFISSFWQRVTQ